MKITVYIPCYNSEKTIFQCIKSLKDQSLKPDEIILINDSSTDKTVEIAKKLKIKICNHKTNKGIAAARNTALKIYKNNLVAGIDSDSVADKDWLKLLYKTMKEEKAVLVGGNVDETIKTFADKWRSIHMNQGWGDKKIINPNYIAGNNFLCSKKELLNIGGYDETFKTNYEDVDISQRLKYNNDKIIYEPKAKVQHFVEDNTKTVLDRHWRYMFWDYPVPNNARNKINKFFINAYTGITFWWNDSLSDAELIFIDLRLFWHHTWKDFKFK